MFRRCEITGCNYHANTQSHLKPHLGAAPIYRKGRQSPSAVQERAFRACERVLQVQPLIRGCTISAIDKNTPGPHICARPFIGRPRAIVPG
jgi:hypothetical protein